ncbi:PucR family transcriptional regulator [Bacillus sp. J33]|uniref:PucR family transcriptional regulator n=1 Tax=Bacillus sp. J33 TaxID=935836 RepID=UPI00047ED77E|nr:PucR family transcriptional regulator [Bacillus sp. J33]
MPFKDSVTLRELLNRSKFQGAKIITGLNSIDRKIKWAHIMEVTEVGELINGGELILTTGIAWADCPEKGVHMLSQLIEQNAAALCIELHTYLREVPAEMVELAHRFHFPIIIFESQVRFIDLTREVYEILHFPDLKQQLKVLFDKLWNHTLLEMENKQTLYEWIPDYAYLPGVPSLIEGHNQLTVLSAIKKEAWKFSISVLFTYIEKMSCYFIFFFDQKHQMDSFKTRITSLINNHQTEATNILFGSFYKESSQLPHSISTLKKAYEITQYLNVASPVFYTDLHKEKILASIIKQGELREWMNEYLSPLIQHDQKHESKLMETLAAYFTYQGNKKETAQALFIVRQTLYHRLEKIKQLIGDDFMSSQKRAMLELLITGYFSQKVPQHAPKIIAFSLENDL